MGMNKTEQMFQEATGLHRSGQLVRAEKLYKNILKRDPSAFDVLRLLGGLYVQTDRAEEGAACLLKAHQIQPANAEVMINLGVAHRNLGKVVEASSWYEKALRVAPTEPRALNNLGGLYQEMGRTNDAMARYVMALQIKPDYPEPHFNLGNIYRERDNFREAAAHYEVAIKLRPNYIDALINLGIAYYELDRPDAAKTRYEQVLQSVPDHIIALNNLGNIYRQKGKPEEAMGFYEKALKIKPDYVEAIVNYGSGLRELGKWEEARACYHKALAIKEKPSTYINLGTIEIDFGHPDLAIEQYDKALALNPDSRDAKWNKSLALLGVGAYREGWSLYEVGLNRIHMRGLVPCIGKHWNGELLAGKRLLIWSEQGLGDTLQFVRYAALCKEQGATIIVLCYPPLTRLFHNCPYIDEVVEKTDGVLFDYQISMMSLPHALDTTVETIPNNVPYLYANPDACAQWAKKLAGGEGFKVGLVWAGNSRENLVNAHLIDKRRSVDLAAMQPLLDLKGACFYSLQIGPKAKQIEEMGLQDQIIDLTGEVKDFADTAAFIENLDLVISVDTSVVHLAGGLGKPVWVLSRCDACWRWLRNIEKNPWYPSARVFGQTSPGDWAGVVERVKMALATEVAEV